MIMLSQFVWTGINNHNIFLAMIKSNDSFKYPDEFHNKPFSIKESDLYELNEAYLNSS